jgi:N-acyl-D-amino-acid deacylase
LTARLLVAAALALVAGCGGAVRRSSSPPDVAPPAPTDDVVIRGGTVIDGTGAPGRVADVAISGDRIAAIGDLRDRRGRTEIDARGKAVTPGFVNMMSGAFDSMMVDGRAASDVVQGVTLEVFGEGFSPGPLTDAMRKQWVDEGEFHYPVTWTSFGGGLEALAAHGVDANVASFVGASTVRQYVLGESSRAPTPEELAKMQALVKQAMEEGALGVGAGLVYPPGVFASTEELTALAKASAPYHGLFVAHMRSEGERLLEAIDEILAIGRDAGVGVEVFHLKAAGKGNWGKLEAAIDRIAKARAAGQRVTADMYVYTASATGLDVSMPPWVEEGGYAAWASRLRDPVMRARVAAAMTSPSTEWENNFRAAPSPDQILLVGFRNPALRAYTGLSLGAIARARHERPEETAMNLVEMDGARVEAIYFLMSEANVKREIALPWVSFCSDADAPAPEEPFVSSSRHPRTYGAFARLLGKYVREERVIPIEEAVRKMTSLPASNLGIKERGTLKAGWFADVVVLDPATIADHATYAKPHQYATGIEQVFVNGTRVVRDGTIQRTHAGRVVRGPGAESSSP